MPKFNINLTDQAYEVLSDISDKSGKSMAEVLRDALALEKWITDELDAGNKFLVERRDGRINEVIIR